MSSFRAYTLKECRKSKETQQNVRNNTYGKAAIEYTRKCRDNVILSTSDRNNLHAVTVAIKTPTVRITQFSIYFVFWKCYVSMTQLTAN